MKAVGLAVIAAIVLPILVVVPLSFSSAQFLSFPPPGYSLRWYQEFFGRDYWFTPAWFSIKVGLTCMVAATVLGTLAALSFVRGAYVGRGVLSAFVIVPMVVPLIISALAFYFSLSKVGLIDTFAGLVIAHTVLALPRVAVMMTSVLQRADVFLEHAAMTLGAGPVQAFRLVTLPAIMPGIMAAAVIAFLTSFDEIIVALFLSGPRSTTLPKRMWDSLLTEMTPALAVVSTFLLVILIGLFAGLSALRGADWMGRWERATKRDAGRPAAPGGRE